MLPAARADLEALYASSDPDEPVVNVLGDGLVEPQSRPCLVSQAESRSPVGVDRLLVDPIATLMHPLQHPPHCLPQQGPTPRSPQESPQDPGHEWVDDEWLTLASPLPDLDVSFDWPDLTLSELMALSPSSGSAQAQSTPSVPKVRAQSAKPKTQRDNRESARASRERRATLRRKASDCLTLTASLLLDLLNNPQNGLRCSRRRLQAHHIACAAPSGERASEACRAIDALVWISQS